MNGGTFQGSIGPQYQRERIRLLRRPLEDHPAKITNEDLVGGLDLTILFRVIWTGLDMINTTFLAQLSPRENKIESAIIERMRFEMPNMQLMLSQTKVAIVAPLACFRATASTYLV